MATKVNLPLPLIKQALEQAMSLRERYVKSATNDIVRQAYEEEANAMAYAITNLETIIEPKQPIQK